MRQYQLPQAIRDAYRDRDLILPRPRPHSEIVRDLNAVAAMPEAADPEIQELLARERLRLRHYCDASEAEREGAWDRDFGLAIAHSEAESENERLTSEELTRGIRHAYRLQQLGWPYEDVLAAWNKLTAEPRDAGITNWIVENRLTLTDEYQRPAEDMEREIQRAMEVFEGQPIEDWANAISSACRRYPTLAEKYLPPLIADLEEKLRERPNPDEQRDLDSIKDDLELARSGLPTNDGRPPGS